MAEIDRTPRADQTRAVEARQWKPAAVLPDVDPVRGYVYRWVAVSILGEADAGNTSKRLREGYEPVKAADHPELRMDADKNGNVVIGGLMLCRMPSEMALQRQAYYENQARNQNEAVTAQYMQQSNSKMPTFAEAKSQTKFGTGSSQS